MTKRKFTSDKIAKIYDQIKTSKLFHETNLGKATEYLNQINDILNYEEEPYFGNDNYEIDLAANKKFVGFFRPSENKDCIAFSVLDTHKQEIIHCSYQIMEDGTIVNVKNLRHERERAIRYNLLEEFATERSSNIHVLSKDDFKNFKKKSRRKTLNKL